MDYENFKEQFVADVKDRLEEQGADAKVSVNEVNKLNESYEAVTVMPEGNNIGLNIGIDKFYDAMEVVSAEANKEMLHPVGCPLFLFLAFDDKYSAPRSGA